MWRWLYRWRREPHETYDTDQKWITYAYFVPDWVTRILGRTAVRVQCCICGRAEFVGFRIPRWGDTAPEGGQHEKRLRIKAEHAHPRRSKNVLTWAKPLKNPAAFQGRA